MRQAWLLRSELVDSERAGWKRPAEDAFVRAFAMHGFAAEVAGRAWREYDGAAGDDARQTAIAELDRELLAVGRGQAICGGKVPGRLRG